MKAREDTYWFWLRACTRMAFPMRHDFYDLRDAVVDLLRALALTALVLAMRALILVTLPISAPLLAWWALRRRLRLREMLAPRRDEASAAFDDAVRVSEGPLHVTIRSDQ